MMLGDELERADARLLQILDRDFSAAADAAGPHLVCRPGCRECCHGPFPITRLDIWRLRRGMAAVGAGDIARRAEAAVRILAPGFPGEPATGRLLADENRLDEFFELHRALPCPALDPATGRCELYEWRPVSCRAYGPPACFGREDSPPCPLCFRGSSRETIESCRMRPDREGLEETILAGMGVAPGEDWETLIAFALRYTACERGNR
jgi:Fe-S-cluster containining protein